MEAERLRDELCEALAFAAPLTWETIRFKVEWTELTSTASTSAVNRDGTPDSFALPDGFMRKVDQFRAACYEPERGTLHSAAITLHANSEPEIAFSYDEKQKNHPTTVLPEAKPAREQHNAARQKEVLDQLTEILLGALPADWQRLVIEYRVVGRHSNARVGLLKHDDQVHDWDPPLEAWHRFQDLRRAMYLTDEGTWFGAQYKLFRPDRFAVKYNWRSRPDFSSEPDPDEFALEQSRFPRAKAHQPQWYRDGLAKASAG